MSVEVFGTAMIRLGDSAEFIANNRQERGAVVTDPPYGINYVISARNWSGDGLDASGRMQMTKRAAIKGDSEPFDPTPLLRFKKAAIFGANHMAGLPRGGKWIVWDKRRDSKPDDHSDCEIIWTNVKGADRIHRQKWRGVVREGEENCSRSRKLHPNQKPVALLGVIFDEIGIEQGDVVIDPFMGSGSTGIVAIRRGLQFIGYEIDPQHFDTACRRLEAEVRAKEAA